MIGKAIKFMRKKYNLKQEVLAKRLKIERTTLSGYEIGRRQADFETIEKIANECGYSICFIDNDTKEMFQLSDLIRKDI